MVSKEPQVYPLEDGAENTNAELAPDQVVSVHFAQKSFEKYHVLLKIQKMAMDGQKLRTRKKNCKSEGKREGYEQEISEKKDAILKLARYYKELMSKEENDAVKNAFVVFRSMEGAARAIEAYNWSMYKRCCTSCCSGCCVDKKTYKRKLFHNKWLQIERAQEPSLIIWENLGFTRGQRCFKICVGVFISILLLAATTAAILWAKIYETSLKQDTITCASEVDITRLQAFEGYSTEDELQYEEMYCYCRGIFWEKLNEQVNPYDTMRETFEDGEMYCWDWFKNYSLSNTLLLAVPFAIVFVTWLSKTILRVST